LTILSKRLSALEAYLAPLPSPCVIATYRRGDDGFDAALAEIVEEGRGKPGAITDQHEVFSISAIRGLEGPGKDLTIVRTIVDPKPEPLPQKRRPETGA
jgi:hypothetical protein